MLTLDWTWPNRESLRTPELKADANFDSLSIFKEIDQDDLLHKVGSTLTDKRLPGAACRRVASQLRTPFHQYTPVSLGKNENINMYTHEMVRLQADCSRNGGFDLSLLTSLTIFRDTCESSTYLLLIWKAYPVNKVPRSCTSTKIWAKRTWVLQYACVYKRLTYCQIEQAFDQKVSWKSVSNAPFQIF